MGKKNKIKVPRFFKYVITALGGVLLGSVLNDTLVKNSLISTTAYPKQIEGNENSYLIIKAKHGDLTPMVYDSDRGYYINLDNAQEKTMNKLGNALEDSLASEKMKMSRLRKEILE